MPTVRFNKSIRACPTTNSRTLSRPIAIDPPPSFCKLVVISPAARCPLSPETNSLAFVRPGRISRSLLEREETPPRELHHDESLFFLLLSTDFSTGGGVLLLRLFMDRSFFVSNGRGVTRHSRRGDRSRVNRRNANSPIPARVDKLHHR